MIQIYSIPEDHEIILLHYFKVINYLQLGSYEEALVECRRINDKINLLNKRPLRKKKKQVQERCICAQPDGHNL